MLAAEALRQMQAPVASAPGIDLGLDRGRRRNQHDRDVGAARPHHRHVAGVVAHAVLLLVGGVVLLVDHDQPEIGIGQEQRRARADDDLDVTGRDRAPGARAQALRKLRVPLRRPHPEALGEAVEELRGQRDLRHQHQRLPSATDGLAHRLEIDLRLAGAGDAVEQRDRIAARGDDRAQRVRRRALRRPEIGRRKIRIGRARHRLGRQHHGLERAFVDQAIDHARRNTGLLGDLALAAHQSIGKQREDAAARHGHALRCGAGEPHPDALARGTEMLAHAQRHAQHHAAGAERVIRDPIDEFAQLRLERRHVELVLDLLHAVVETGIGVRVFGPHHRGCDARTERHGHEIARHELEPFRHPVGIGLIEGDREEDIDDTLGHGLSANSQGLRKGKGAGVIMHAVSRDSAAGR